MASRPEPNDHPVGDMVFQSGIALAVLATIAVLLRLLARWKTKAKTAVDDLFIVISLLPFYGMVILSCLGKLLEYFDPSVPILMVSAVRKVHAKLSLLTSSDLRDLMKVRILSSLNHRAVLVTYWQILLATIFTYSLAITLVKISILLLYRRLFPTSLFQTKTLIVGGLCIAWFLVSILVEFFQCRSFSMLFEYTKLFGGSCINVRGYWWGVCASNIFLDLVVLCLPIHEVWKLQLPKQKKVMLSGVFTLGGL